MKNSWTINFISSIITFMIKHIKVTSTIDPGNETQTNNTEGAYSMQRKQWSPEQKLQIVTETMKKERHIGEIASEYGVHVSAIHRWRKKLIGSAEKIFAATKSDKAAAREKREQEEIIENLYIQVGRLTVQLDWLKKNPGGTLPRL